MEQCDDAVVTYVYDGPAEVLLKAYRCEGEYKKCIVFADDRFES